MYKPQMIECFKHALSLKEDEQKLLVVMMDMAVRNHQDPKTLELPDGVAADFMSAKDLLDVIQKVEQFNKKAMNRKFHNPIVMLVILTLQP